MMCRVSNYLNKFQSHLQRANSKITATLIQIKYTNQMETISTDKQTSTCYGKHIYKKIYIYIIKKKNNNE